MTCDRRNDRISVFPSLLLMFVESGSSERNGKWKLISRNNHFMMMMASLGFHFELNGY